TGNSACQGIPAGGSGPVWAHGLLVCADAAVVLEQRTHADRDLLVGDDRVGAAGVESVAARDASSLFCVLSFVCECVTRFFRISIGRHATGSRIHFVVFCAEGIPARMGRGKSAFARKLVSAGVGMLSNLLRVGRGKNYGRRSAVAELHGDG